MKKCDWMTCTTRIPLQTCFPDVLAVSSPQVVSFVFLWQQAHSFALIWLVLYWELFCWYLDDILSLHNPYFFQYAKQTYAIIASSNEESIVQLFRFVCVSINVFGCYKCNYIDMFLLLFSFYWTVENIY